MTSSARVRLVRPAPSDARWRMHLFPDTLISVVARLSSVDDVVRERATEMVIAAYRAPVITVLQRRWVMDIADAEDLAHDFFLQALARDWLARYDPERGRFRTFLRTCLFDFAATAHEAATRKKRGGGAVHVSLDERLNLSTGDDFAAVFDHEWTRSVLSLALTAFHDECVAAGRDTSWDVFIEYDVRGAEDDPRPTYAALAERFAIPITQVTNYLNWARRRFREHVLAVLRELTANDDEFRSEVFALLGVSP